MQYRRLGRTNLEVSEIGFGAWGIGKGWWGETDDPLSVRTLLRAFELGVTFIDTAYGYGDGHSEQLIAKAFQEYRERVTVSTKIPLKTPDWPPQTWHTGERGFPRRLDHRTYRKKPPQFTDRLHRSPTAAYLAGRMGTGG